MHKKSTILILILTIVAVLIAFGFLAFMFKVIQNKNKHASKVFTTLQDKIIEKKNMTAVNQKLSEVEATHKSIKGYFLDSKQVDIFVGYLEKIGVDTNTDLSVKGLDVLASDKSKLSFKVLTKGTFSNIMQIISLLENSPYQISINQVSLNKELVESAVAADPKNKNKKVTPPTILWRSDISFTILKL